MTARPTRLTNGMRWTTIILVLATLLFSWAIVLEQGSEMAAIETGELDADGGAEPGETTTVEGEAGESAEGHDESSEGGEALFGLNLENPVITWGFVAISLALAGGLLLAPRIALIPTIVLASAATILDVREVLLQVAAPQLAALAGATAVAHAAVVLLAVVSSRSILASQRRATS